MYGEWKNNARLVGGPNCRPEHAIVWRALIHFSDDFPADFLVEPQQVKVKSGDGLEIHAQLFLPKSEKPSEKRPALIFLHGGPIRQMLLRRHYMYYYSHSYALNHYLATPGYIVLALNYRRRVGHAPA